MEHTLSRGRVTENTQEQTQSRNSHRLGAHSWYKELNQEHTKIKGTVAPESKHRAVIYTDQEHKHTTMNQSRSTLIVEARWQGTPEIKPRAGADIDWEHTISTRNQKKQEHSENRRQQRTPQSRSHRFSAHNWHEEPKQKHTESRGTVAGNTQEQSQSRSILIAGGTKAGAHPCTVHLSVVAHGFQEHTVKRNYSWNKTIHSGVCALHTAGLILYSVTSLITVSFVLSLANLLKNCHSKYSVKMLQSMNGIFVNMKRMKILSYN